MRKPEGCLGCPLFGDGDGFVPDEIIGAKVDVWLQNPGETEERKGVPAVGSTGDDLNTKFLPIAGLERGKDVNVRNVLRCRMLLPDGKKTNNLPTGKTLARAVEHCRLHDKPTDAEVSIAAGALAWRLFNGPGSVTDWRGFTHPEKKVLATLHPADLYRNPTMELPVKMDWSKVPRLRAGTWPREIPPFLVVERGSDTHLVTEWVQQALEAAPYVVLDTEFTRDTRYLTTLGLGYPDATGCQIWFNGLDPVARQVVRVALWRLVNKVPVVFQNAMADVPVLERNLGIKYSDYYKIEDTMLAHAVLWSEWPHDLGYLASIYGQYPKMKHLHKTNPKLYNWGDVLDTQAAWDGLQSEFSKDRVSADVYNAQSLPLVPIILKSMAKGLRIDKEVLGKVVDDCNRRKEWATYLVRAVVGRKFNLGSEKQLKDFLYQDRGYPAQFDKHKKLSTGGDAIAALRKLVGPMPDLEDEENNGLSPEGAMGRIEQGADPILEARVVYAAAVQEEGHFLAPLIGKERVHPEIKIHAQASGRWSITNPPLQQFPGHLQNLFIPDEGEVWIGWDWDQIELRLLAALAGDVPYLQAFEKGWDIHTINACDIFGLAKPSNLSDPHKSPEDAGWRQQVGWLGKDDPRRVFAKRFVYRLNYGGDARTAGDIPGAKQLNLTPDRLVDASRRYLAAHPAMAAWRVEVAAEAQRTHVSRTFMGRRRRLLGSGPRLTREAYNHPMQGGVADILNTCTIQIAQRLPSLSLAYTVHDSAWWSGKEQDFGTESLSVIQEVVTQPWQINGRSIAFPVSFKSRLPQ